MKKSLLAVMAATAFFGATSAANAGVFFSLNTYAPPPPPRYIVTDYWRGTGYYAYDANPVYVTHSPRYYYVSDYPRYRHRDRDHDHDHYRDHDRYYRRGW